MAVLASTEKQEADQAVKGGMVGRRDEGAERLSERENDQWRDSFVVQVASSFYKV